MKPTILVTSAGGHTGLPAVLKLLKRGFPVRAFVRQRDSRADRLAAAGAEIFMGDQLNYRDLRRALAGVRRAYHCPPFAPNALQATTLFAIAAAEAKLEAVALMNAWNPHPVHPAIHQREQWIAAEIYRWLPDTGVIFLHPGLFAFPYFFGLPAAIHFGQLLLPFGEGLNAPPSNEDIAEIAAAVLADPAPHIGCSYRPTGPELLSGHDVATDLSTVLGRSVTYRDVSTRMFIKAALAAGLSWFEVSQIRRYVEEVRAGAYAIGAPTDHVQQVCGRPAEPFVDVVRRYVADPTRVWPQLRIGGRLDALTLLLRTMVTRVPDLDAWEAARGHPRLAGAELAHESAEWLADHNEAGRFGTLPGEPKFANNKL